MSVLLFCLIFSFPFLSGVGQPAEIRTKVGSHFSRNPVADLLRTVPKESQTRVLLKNDDGKPVGPNSYDRISFTAEIKELTRFEAPHRTQIERLRFVTNGKEGTIIIHVWSDIDSSVLGYVPFHGFEFDVIRPVHIDLSKVAGNGWVDVDLLKLGAAFMLEPGMRVFVGAKVTPDGVRFACDRSLNRPGTSTVEIYDPATSSGDQSKLFDSAGDFLVRLEGSSRPVERTPNFIDVTHTVSMPRLFAESFAWADINGDGWDDLLVNGTRLFLNAKGKSFREYTKKAGLNGRFGQFGLFADVENDGDLDLFIAGKGRTVSDSIYLNDGNGHFRIDSAAISPERNFACAGTWLEINGDGQIDLFVANGTQRGDLGAADRDAVYLNSNSGGLRESHELTGTKSTSFSSVATAGDLTGDGRSELFVGTYRLEPDQLWRFDVEPASENAAELGLAGGPTAAGRSGFGHALGANMADLDLDGDLDVIVANLIHPDWRGFQSSNESWFFENLGDLRFQRKMLRGLGVAFEETISDPTIADFDNDGRLDLFHNSWYHSANLYVWRDSLLYDRTASSGLNASQANASAFCDYDRDGRIDLIVADKQAGMKLYRNTSPTRPWIELRLSGAHCNRAAIGAVARIKTSDGILTRAVSAGRGQGEQDSMVLHFGLGDRTAPVTAEITWPCGHRQKVNGLGINSLHLISEEVAGR